MARMILNRPFVLRVGVERVLSVDVEASEVRGLVGDRVVETAIATWKVEPSTASDHDVPNGDMLPVMPYVPLPDVS